jgi:transcriptional regulator with XRE-family HTH domain
MEIHPSTRDIMSTAEASVDRAREWSTLLENREAFRTGRSLKEARKEVARREGVSPGTLENLRRGRLKTIATHWYERLRGALIRELMMEVRRLEHEITILNQTGVDPRSDEVASVVADLARVRQALGLPPGGRL